MSILEKNRNRNIDVLWQDVLWSYEKDSRQKARSTLNSLLKISGSNIQVRPNDHWEQVYLKSMQWLGEKSPDICEELKNSHVREMGAVSDHYNF